MLINGREKKGIKKLKKSKAFIDYSQTSEDVYENLEDYNPTQKGRVLIVFDYMITDIKANKKLSSVVTELFLWGRKLTILLVFILRSYFEVPKTMPKTKWNTLFYYENS